MRRRLLIGVPLIALALFPVVRPYDAYSQAVLLLAFLLAIQAVSWNIISGYAGYVSLGHGAFLGLGAYTAGIVGVHTGLNPFLVAPLGGVVATVAAVLLGAVVLRARGHAFVIITIALLFATQVVVTNWASLTGGSDGITLALPPWSRDYQNVPFYAFFYVLMLLTIGFSAALRRTKFGTGLVAIREDEGKAAAVGVPATRFKIVAYGASAFFIGVAGSGYAYFLTFLNPVGAFSILGSVSIVLAALVGGRGTLWGPVVGAFAVQLASEAATVYGGGAQARVLLFGVALVLVVLFFPEGVAGHLRRRPTPTVYIDPPRGSCSSQPRMPDMEADKRKIGDPLLEVCGVSKRFGGLSAVDRADLTVAQGSVTGLIGPNGSGKTTLFNLVSGGLRPEGGEIRFAGRRIDRLPPWTRCHLGLGRTFQLTRLFPTMTVLENVVAPLPDARWRTALSGAVHGHEAERARDLLGFVGMARFADVRAGALSYGQQKLVELAQVLMLEPRLILLDEPAGGVNPTLVDRLCDLIRDLNARGVTFLVVEHNLPMVLELCDPVVVFSRGAPIACGPPGSIRDDPAVLDAYLGDEWVGERVVSP